MKLFIYSDVHISRTSSILPLTSSVQNYTYRQNMIIETARWMSGLINDLKPDMILNLGDTFDQNTLSSYDVDTANEFFNKFPKRIPHFILCGNHEMLNQDYNVLKLLDNKDNISIIDKPETIENIMTLVPYCDYNDLDLSQYNSKYLFLHHDIYGSKVSPTNTLDFGISQDSLSKFDLVFNGHVHASSRFGNVINVGSITTHSFADSSETVPTCYLFDTITQEITEYSNICCPLFRKIPANTIEELHSSLGILDSRFNYVLHIDCAFEIKQEVEGFLKDIPNIITYKITTKSIKQDEQIQENEVKIESNLDVMKSFKDFLNTGVELRYPMNLYNEILETQETQKAQGEINVNDMPKYDTEQVLNTWAEQCEIKKENQENTDKISNVSGVLF